MSFYVIFLQMQNLDLYVAVWFEAMVTEIKTGDDYKAALAKGSGSSVQLEISHLTRSSDPLLSRLVTALQILQAKIRRNGSRGS